MTAIGTAASNAVSEVNSLRSAIESVPTERTITFRINTVGSIPSGGTVGGGLGFYEQQNIVYTQATSTYGCVTSEGLLRVTLYGILGKLCYYPTVYYHRTTILCYIQFEREQDMKREINQGWEQTDEWYLNQYDNPNNDPDIQIFDEGNFEDEDKEEREYFCTICKSKLDYLKNMDMWYCEACVQYYDTKIQDIPIKNIKDSRVKTYAELEHYHQLDDDDIFLPFVQGINPDTEENIPSNVEVVSDDGYRKHMRVKGLPVEALSAMRELDRIEGE
jgi:hypothetical protein